jgi:hypothetical protein
MPKITLDIVYPKLQVEHGCSLTKKDVLTVQRKPSKMVICTFWPEAWYLSNDKSHP